MPLKLPSRDDKVTIVSLIESFYDSQKLPYGAFDPNKISSLVDMCLDPERTDNVLIAWEEQGNVVGILAGQVTEVIFNRELVATELVWYIDPAYRKTEVALALLGAFEYWADFRGCKYVQMIGLQNEYAEVLGRYYKRNGYSPAEASYVKEI